ncbi:hypothetical protein [uncultured Amphritea sp.]|uniref:hypothetical protein n=1 Tax=uncultured Amphritea sp. TaxID=981605 RepID=UPI00262738B4|nr:hypothetical protein [uncultured Amphritea sp.]
MNKYIVSFLAASALAFSGTAAMAQDSDRCESQTEEHRTPTESITEISAIADSDLSSYTGSKGNQVEE